MKLVILESPYSGDIEANVAYARACVADCLRRGESFFPSHLLFTQPGVLDDAIPSERKLGMEAGFADKTVVYTDKGVTDGMRQGVRNSRKPR
jgi:hypothetical protein